jgi:hypothetical protein
MMTEASSEFREKTAAGRIPPAAKIVLGFILLGTVTAFADLAIRGFSRLESLSLQSREMLARSETLDRAVQPGVWPPGYPLVLWLGRKAGVPPAAASRLLFVAALLIGGNLYRRLFPGRNALWFILLYAGCAFHYYNLAQFTAEALVIPLSLGAFWSLTAYIRKQKLSSLLGLSVFCSVIFISRYHALAWLLPIVGVLLFFALKYLHRQAWIHMTAFVLVALVPVGLVMRENVRVTRHLTGMRRFDRDIRRLPGELEYFKGSIGFEDNVRLTAKTVSVDFLSSKDLATHEVNRTPYRVPWPEWGILAVLAAVLGTAAYAVSRERFSGKRLASVLRREFREAATPGFLAGEFFIGYVVITIVLWSVGNNDPIYSRFMYPSYPFLILWGFGVFSYMKEKASAPVLLWPFRFLYLSVLAVNLYKIGWSLGWLS